MNARSCVLASVLIGGTILFAGCQAASPASQTSTTPTSAVVQNGSPVSIVNMSFSPATITIKAGGTVTWTNNDSLNHTVTDDGGAFDSGNLAVGASYSHTYTTAGKYPYHCTYHTQMLGTVIVQ